jgi:hypothetical protein
MSQGKIFKEHKQQPNSYTASSQGGECLGFEYTPVTEPDRLDEYIFTLPSVSITVTKHHIRGYALEPAIIW